MAYNYQIIGPSNSSFGGTSQTFSNSPQNSISLYNANQSSLGTAFIEIHALTTFNLVIPYQSYSFQSYILDNEKVSGTYFNNLYARLWYGINSESVRTGSQNVNVDTNYYTGTNLPYGVGNWTSLTPDTTTSQFIDVNGTINVTVQEGDYFVLLITGPTTPTGSFNLTAMVELTGLPTATGFCFSANSKILMENMTYKPISSIKRGDVVIQDINTNEKAIVSKVYHDIITNDIVCIPKQLLNNKEELYCTGLHPIWIDNKRVYAKNINGVIIKSSFCGEFYNLQFDEEGTFIIDGIKVDSLSPYHKKYSLSKTDFIDETKFIPNLKVKHENDKFRNKPHLEIK